MTNRARAVFTFLVGFAFYSVAWAGPAKVFFVSPKTGDTVSSPVKLSLGVEGVSVLSNSKAKKEPGSGHHTIIIQGGWISSGSVVPKDGKHLHLDDGANETSVTLAPGEYTVTAQLADGDEKSLGEALSQTIYIKVK